MGHGPDSACGWRCAGPSEVAGISAAPESSPEVVITSPAGFPASKSVITSLAGFDGLASALKAMTRRPASARVVIFGETGRSRVDLRTVALPSPRLRPHRFRHCLGCHNSSPRRSSPQIVLARLLSEFWDMSGPRRRVSCPMILSTRC